MDDFFCEDENLDGDEEEEECVPAAVPEDEGEGEVEGEAIDDGEGEGEGEGEGAIEGEVLGGEEDCDVFDIDKELGELGESCGLRSAPNSCYYNEPNRSSNNYYNGCPDDCVDNIYDNFNSKYDYDDCGCVDDRYYNDRKPTYNDRNSRNSRDCRDTYDSR
jgi:hypothetical protein